MIAFQWMICILVRASDKRITMEEEFSDSEDEDGGRRDRSSLSHKKIKRLKTDNNEKKDAEKGRLCLSLCYALCLPKKYLLGCELKTLYFLTNVVKSICSPCLASEHAPVMVILFFVTMSYNLIIFICKVQDIIGLVS